MKLDLSQSAPLGGFPGYVAASPGATAAAAWSCEERLQEALAAHPFLIDGPEGASPRLLLGREIGIGETSSKASLAAMGRDRGRGWADLVFVEEDGLPTVVEAKVCSNPTMKTVVKQAYDYVRGLVDRPFQGRNDLFNALTFLCGRDVNGRGPANTVAHALPHMNLMRLREATLGHLSLGRCRLVIAADWISPNTLAAAQALRSREKSLVVDLVEVTKDSAGVPTARLVRTRSDCRSRPNPGDADWELVPRVEVAADVILKGLRKDRFYERTYSFRCLEVSPWPDRLYLEVAPGRAPRGDLHQIERSRLEGCAPMMPDWSHFREEGIPYPVDFRGREITDKAYQGFTAISRETWSRLNQFGELVLSSTDARSLQVELVEKAGFRMVVSQEVV